MRLLHSSERARPKSDSLATQPRPAKSLTVLASITLKALEGKGVLGRHGISLTALQRGCRWRGVCREGG